MGRPYRPGCGQCPGRIKSPGRGSAPRTVERSEMANEWFETVAEAQRRAKKRLPKSVYGALIAGSERGSTLEDNVTAFGELGFAPHVAGQPAERDLTTKVMGQEISFPVMISPTGVQAVHPEGEVAVARAAAARGTAMGLSSFASMPIEDVVAANPQTFFQIYWIGSARADPRSRRAGPGRRCRRPHRHPRLVLLPRARLGQSDHPREGRLRAPCCAFAPEALSHPRVVVGLRQDRQDPRPDDAQHGAPRASRRPPSSGPTASGCRRRRRVGRTWPGSASSGAVPSCSRASPGSTTPSAPSTPASPPFRSRTTAATTSTGPRPPSACSRPSPMRSAIRSRCCSTAACAAAATP